MLDVLAIGTAILICAVVMVVMEQFQLRRSLICCIIIGSGMAAIIFAAYPKAEELPIWIQVAYWLLVCFGLHMAPMSIKMNRKPQGPIVSPQSDILADVFGEDTL